MSNPAPVVYLLHGEDEFGMKGFVTAIQEKLGDATTAEMNTNRFEGMGYDIEAIRSAAVSMPFLAPRRLVVVENISGKVGQSSSEREKFKTLMDSLPESTALVLVETKELNASHWLMQWCNKAGERAYLRSYATPKGAELTNWIRKYVVEHGGEITPQAASLLAESVHDDTRMVALEVEKLLAFVNYARTVDVDDVEMAAAVVGKQGDYFKFIDAISARNPRLAMDMLEKLLDEGDALPLFFSLVGHFRTLLQTREIYEGGGQDGAVAKTLGKHPYVAKKMIAQARTMSLQSLERIYLRLKELDLQIKTGQIEPGLALELLVIELSQ